MGIKNFSQVFEANRVIKWKDYAGKTVAIDTFSELYRSSLGAQSVSTLTDSNGNPTLHISVLLATILEIHRNNVNQIWVFDHDQNPNADFHNPAKLAEILRRKKKKDEAAAEMKTLKDFQQLNEKPMFSDDEEDEEKQENKDNKENKQDDNKESTKDVTQSQTQQRIDSLEKRTFRVSADMITDVKLMLNCLNITYVEAPAGYEGEEVASHLTNMGKADAVYSGDTDPVAYGAKVLLRRNPKDKKVYEYLQSSIIKQIADGSAIDEPTISDIRKVAVILGTDLSAKTPGVGAKTVLKKLHTIKLTKEQEKAIKLFSSELDESKLTMINADKVAFGTDCMKDNLIEWLVNVKSFQKNRILASFEKKAPTKTTKTKQVATTLGKKSTGKTTKTAAATKPKKEIIKKPLPMKRVNGRPAKMSTNIQQIKPQDKPIDSTDDKPQDSTDDKSDDQEEESE